ncbi:MAG: hypothetical protein IPO22_16055 [Anaerolineales bacterium]|nr:hypothetical protein [Anaerolineales bacterium]
MLGQHPEIHLSSAKLIDQTEGKYQPLDNVIKESITPLPAHSHWQRRVAEDVELAEGTVPAGKSECFASI